jgi:hypothetical protein
MLMLRYAYGWGRTRQSPIRSQVSGRGKPRNTDEEEIGALRTKEGSANGNVKRDGRILTVASDRLDPHRLLAVLVDRRIGTQPVVGTPGVLALSGPGIGPVRRCPKTETAGIDQATRCTQPITGKIAKKRQTYVYKQARQAQKDGPWLVGIQPPQNEVRGAPKCAHRHLECKEHGWFLRCRPTAQPIKAARIASHFAEPKESGGY